MPLNLKKWEGKTLDSATLDEIAAAVAAETEAFEARASKAEDKARAAARESIEGRKGKDSRIARMAELLGIEPDADLDDLPDAEGQAEAAKQFEARNKRLERELADERKTHGELQGRYKAERRERAVAEQLAKHPFADTDVARAFIGTRLREEGDELLFETEAGKLVPLADGAAWVAKTKPGLLKPEGANQGTGSGFKGNTGSGQANPWAARTLNITQQIALRKENPALADQLQTAAAQAA